MLAHRRHRRRLLPSAPYLPPKELAAANAVIDRAAEDAGRSPADVRRLYDIGGSFTGTGREFPAARPRCGPSSWPSSASRSTTDTLPSHLSCE